MRQQILHAISLLVTYVYWHFLKLFLILTLLFINHQRYWNIFAARYCCQEREI